MPKIIRVAAAGGAALLLGSAAAWPPSGSSAPPGAAPVLRVSPEPLRPTARCGGEPTAHLPAAQSPLPNAYMVANGRISALADVFVCAKQLHTARFT